MEKLLSENSIAENMSLLSTSWGKYEVTDLGKKPKCWSRFFIPDTAHSLDKECGILATYILILTKGKMLLYFSFIPCQHLQDQF